MKTKLTLTIDRDLIPRAKQYAEARGVSLSSLVEGVLRELWIEEEGSFSSRWRGKFQARKSAESGTEPRFEKLRERGL